jgi:hypothetical protein
LAATSVPNLTSTRGFTTSTMDPTVPSALR